MASSFLAFSSVESFEIKKQSESDDATYNIIVHAPKLQGRTLYLHHGFDGWDYNKDNFSDGFSRQYNHKYYYRRRPFQNLKDGHFRYTLQFPKGTKAVHFVFCWDHCGSGMWDRNEGKDYGFAKDFPLVGPYLTVHRELPPTESIQISFEHFRTGTSYVRYWERGAKIKQSIISSNKRMHHIEIANLKPDTIYEYEVGILESEIKSEVFTFKTLKEKTDQQTFLLFGDAQDNGRDHRFSEIIDHMVSANFDSDFVISTGDLAYNDTPADWWQFFYKAKDLLANKIFLPAIGNHDTPGFSSNKNSGSFTHYFNMPYINHEKAYYGVQMGMSHFLMFNSEWPEDFKEEGDQYQWLLRNELDLEGWNFTAWHIPPINVGARHGGIQKRYRPIAEEFKGKIDWHFGGHEHTYQRFLPIGVFDLVPHRYTEYGKNADQGTGVMIVPPAGTTPSGKIFPLRDHQYSNLRNFTVYPTKESSVQTKPVNGYIRIDLQGNKFRSRAFVSESREKGFFTLDEVQYERGLF